MITLEEDRTQADNAAIEQARQEFIRELYQRRSRTAHFGVCRFDGEKELWESYVWKCRNWDEVERWLNLHKVDWDKEKGRIAGPGFEIYRCN